MKETCCSALNILFYFRSFVCYNTLFQSYLHMYDRTLVMEDFAHELDKYL